MYKPIHIAREWLLRAPWNQEGPPETRVFFLRASGFSKPAGNQVSFFFGGGRSPDFDTFKVVALEVRCDFVVGADGLKSRVRGQLLGDGAPRRGRRAVSSRQMRVLTCSPS